jgi:hypothetical protein
MLRLEDLLYGQQPPQQPLGGAPTGRTNLRLLLEEAARNGPPVAREGGAFGGLVGPPPPLHLPNVLASPTVGGDNTTQTQQRNLEVYNANEQQRLQDLMRSNNLTPRQAQSSIEDPTFIPQVQPEPRREIIAPDPSPARTTGTEQFGPPVPAPMAVPETSSATPPDPLEAMLRQVLSGQGTGTGGGGQGSPAGSGNPAVPRSLANIPRPDNAAVLAQYDRAAPPQERMNSDEQHLMGLLGGIAGIHFTPGQRLGFGLQGAAAGGVEGYGNERLRQRNDMRADAREGRQHQAGRASLEAQLAGQDYERQVGSERFAQSERFHQEQQATARAGIAASQANAAATRQMQGLGLMIRLQALRQNAATQNLDLDAGSMASRIAPRLSGSAGASQRLALPGGLGLQFGTGPENSNLPIAEVEKRAGDAFDASLRTNPELRTRVLMAGANDTTRRDYIQRQVEQAFMGTLGNLSQQAATDPAAYRQLNDYLNWMRRSTIVSRSSRNPTQNPDLGSLD